MLDGWLLASGLEANEAGPGEQVFARPTARPQTKPGIPSSFKGGKFYMYNDPEFNFFDAVECYKRNHNGTDIWSDERMDTVQDTGELWLFRALSQHPNRTLDPEEADLFYVPAFLATSYRMKHSCGFSHYERMLDITDALTRMPYWDRHQGADHLFSCGWWRCGDALRPLRNLLRVHEASILSIMERVKWWTGWRCPERLVTHPYVANHEVTKKFTNTPFSERSTSFFFVGCSRWRAVRSNINVLKILDGTYIYIKHNCKKFTVGADAYAEMIMDSRFCLIPRGDTYTSRRLFDAVAAGCIPIIQDGGIRRSLPFKWKLKYKDFAVFAPTQVFQNSSLLLTFCSELLDRPVERFEEMQMALLSIRDDLVWGEGDPFAFNSRIGRVGNNVLYEAIYKSSQWKFQDVNPTEAACKGAWPDLRATL